MVSVLGWCQGPAEPTADLDPKPGKDMCVDTCSVLCLCYFVLSLKASLYQQGSAQVHSGPGQLCFAHNTGGENVPGCVKLKQDLNLFSDMFSNPAVY